MTIRTMVAYIDSAVASSRSAEAVASTALEATPRPTVEVSGLPTSSALARRTDENHLRCRPG